MPDLPQSPTAAAKIPRAVSRLQTFYNPGINNNTPGRITRSMVGGRVERPMGPGGDIE